MAALITGLLWWHWLIIGMLLLIAEIAAPASFFIWTAIAACLVSLILLLVPELHWTWQFVLFGVLSIVSLLAGRSWLKHRPIKTDKPTLNRRSEQYVGRILTLSEAIEDDYGSVRVDDSRWRVKGPQLPAGHKIRVVRVDGTVFLVEAAE